MVQPPLHPPVQLALGHGKDPPPNEAFAYGRSMVIVRVHDGEPRPDAKEVVTPLGSQISYGMPLWRQTQMEAAVVAAPAISAAPGNSSGGYIHV